MISTTLSNLWWRRYLARNASSWDDLERFADLRPDARRKEIGERLLQQIRYFGAREDALPEWREAARICNSEDLLRIWEDLPIVTKKDLRERFVADDIARRFHLSGQINSSGGSTGEPVHFFHDSEMLKSILAVNIFSAVSMGWQPGMPTITVWGSERDIKKHTSLRSRVHTRLRNQFLVDSYNLTDKTVDTVCTLINRGPVAIYGFTSMLEFIARRVLETGRSIPRGMVRVAWSGGEMLFREQSETFRQAFGVPILNRYGGRELGTMACQPNESSAIRVMLPRLFLEVLNERGRPVGPGETGRLVWTSTVCRGTPFLRYDVEDLGTFRSSDCDESGVRAIDELHGRVAGLLELPDGRKINNIYWNHFFKEVKEVAQFQVRLCKDGSLLILLQGKGFSPERQVVVRGLLAHFLGDLPVALKWVDRIPLTKEGKLVQVYREN